LCAYGRRISEIFRKGKEVEEKLERDAERLLRLPAFLVRPIVALRNWLDSWNLLPESQLRDDPLCTSIFVANLGSLGLLNGYHHLCDTGSSSAFAILWSIETQEVATGDGTTGRRDFLPIHWTIDERVVDGFTGATAFRRLQALMEDPVQLAGVP